MRKYSKQRPLLIILFLLLPFGHRPAVGQTREAGSSKPDQPVQRVIIRLATPSLLQYRLTTFPASSDSELRSLSGSEQQSLQAHARRLETEQQYAIADLQARGLLVQSTRRYTRLFNGFVALVPTTRLKEVAAVPGIRSVSADTPVRASLAASVPLIGAPAVWAMTDPLGRPVRGQGMRVAIIDTGVDYTHPDLGGCFGPACKVAAGYDFVNEDNDPRDDNSHGTHVAGIIAASGATVGVAPEATLYALKVLDAQGSGWTSDVIAALEWAVDPDGNPTTADGAHVINLSLGGPGNPDDAVSLAVDAAVDAGVVVAVAAGNAGDQGWFTIGSPGTARNALTVGASTKTDGLASFSSKGPVQRYWLLKPDLLAPGSSINSTIPGASYEQYNGTSMASPHVAGAAALLRQLHPDWSPRRVKAVLMNTALDLGLDVLAQGTGRVQLAVAAAPWAVAEPGSLSLGIDVLGEAVWTTTNALSLTNMRGSSATYDLSVGPGLPAGVTASLSAANLTLAPGASAPVTVTVQVDNNVLVPPGTPTFTVAGRILVQGPDQVLRVPFGFGVQQGADAYEPDDNSSQAKPIPTDGTHQTHNFHATDDEDWVSFTAVGGTTYVIETGTLGPDCDTVLSLIDGDGATELAYDDDSGVGLASLITWAAPVDGTYFLRVRNYNGSVAGDSAYFDVWVSAVEMHPDSYEPDDTPAQAAVIPTDGTHQIHNFHDAGDEDWIAFTATAGTIHTLETGKLGLTSDTILHLYDTDGTTELADDDDGADEALASRIIWNAPSSGTYFVRVHHFNRNTYGDETRYEVWISACSLSADFNGDSVVNLADVQEIAGRWGQTSGTSGWDPRFDLDQDGNVDMTDVMLVAAAWEDACQ